MSFFILKAIALITMLVDHVGLVVGSYKGLIPGEYVIWMRSIGRIAFPIFAFLIVNGWKHTSNKNSYIKRLVSFAALSQIPFSLAFSLVNFGFKGRANAFKDISLKFIPSQNKVFILAIVFLLSYILTYKRTEVKTSISIIIMTLFSLVSIRLSNNYVISEASYLNVFYTLMVASIAIREFEFIRDNFKDSSKYLSIILRLIMLGSLSYLILPVSDYGFGGLILILSIYFLRDYKALYLLAMGLWLYKHYAYGKPLESLLFLASLASIVAVFLYNGKKGSANKISQKIAYYFYPVHLVLLGLLAFI